MKAYVELDDFCEGNTSFHLLQKIKEEIPSFKVTLFTIVGRCSHQWLESMKKIEWIDMVPHGFFHDTPRECQDWSYDKSMLYLKYIEQFGLTKGFRAPGWQISDGMYKALFENHYWVADQTYNDKRRPFSLRAWLLNNPNFIHGHIGHLGGHNPNELSLILPSIKKHNDFGFVKDYMDAQI